MKRCVIVGTGHRGLQAYVLPILKELPDCVDLCAVYDINPKRAAYTSVLAKKEIPVYEDFDKMLAEVKPDTVIVTTKDCIHDEYIIKALEFGCDVVSEKPMTTDEKKCNAILEAEKKSGKDVKVTFNCRFMPFFVRVKELLLDDVIGDVLSVHYEWMLDTSHGADYFRRWHRERKNSGSLLIHKSTHHFDLLNWWLEDEPAAVNAFGTRRFYGPTRENRGERCLTCKYKNSCEFYFDIEADDFYKHVYLETEDVDGYYRDKCVFSEEIDIEDSVAVNIRYKKGAVVSYSLTAHSPYEGCKIVFNGTKGRMEVENVSTGVYANNPVKTIRIFNRLNEEITYTIPQDSMLTNSMNEVSRLSKDNLGGHGGSDPLMRAMIFRGAKTDKLGQLADTRAGSYSIGIGIAANKSMAENRQVLLSEFLPFKD